MWLQGCQQSQISSSGNSLRSRTSPRLTVLPIDLDNSTSMRGRPRSSDRQWVENSFIIDAVQPRQSCWKARDWAGHSPQSICLAMPGRTSGSRPPVRWSPFTHSGELGAWESGKSMQVSPSSNSLLDILAALFSILVRKAESLTSLTELLKCVIGLKQAICVEARRNAGSLSLKTQCKHKFVAAVL